MRYVRAKYEEYNADLAYRIYVTDCLYYQGENKHLTKRYNEVLHPAPIDRRTGDEIARDVISRLGLKVE